MDADTEKSWKSFDQNKDLTWFYSKQGMTGSEIPEMQNQ